MTDLSGVPQRLFAVSWAKRWKREAAVDYKKIKLTVADHVATITLSDPATMNAAGLGMVVELADAFGRVAKGEDGARAVILTGEGRGFCSGANLSGGGPAARAREGDGRPDAGSALESHYNPFVTLMRDFPMPIVTAVNGAAAGVGCSLALMGDLVVAAESAYFLQAPSPPPPASARRFILPPAPPYRPRGRWRWWGFAWGRPSRGRGPGLIPPYRPPPQRETWVTRPGPRHRTRPPRAPPPTLL